MKQNDADYQREKQVEETGEERRERQEKDAANKLQKRN